jgi:hypothetical protein
MMLVIVGAMRIGVESGAAANNRGAAVWKANA